MKRKWFKISIITVVSLVLVVTIAFFVYTGNYYHYDGDIDSMLSSTDNVIVTKEDDGSIVFMPDNPKAGLIFYPGGKVEYTAYAPLLKELAQEDILCVLLKMPFNLAVFDINKAEGITDKYNNIDVWYIGGHSLGGAMSAEYIKNHEDIDGLILLAAFSSCDISDKDINCISIFGSNDQILNKDKYEKYRSNLPNQTKEYVIEGGNHSYFGNYGLQDGDGQASITRGQQRDITVKYISENICK